MKKIAGILVGILLTSVGVTILKGSHIATGGTAGLALAGSYIFNMSFSQIFFLINVPFYVFSYFQMGIKFTLSTIASVSLLSFLTGIISFSSFIPYTFPAFIGYIISINRNLSGSASAATGSTHSTATRKTATASST